MSSVFVILCRLRSLNFCVGTAMFAGSISTGSTCGEIHSDPTHGFLLDDHRPRVLVAAGRIGPRRPGGFGSAREPRRPPSEVAEPMRRAPPRRRRRPLPRLRPPPVPRGARVTPPCPRASASNPSFGSVNFRLPHANRNAAAALPRPRFGEGPTRGEGHRGDSRVNGDARSTAAASGPDPEGGRRRRGEFVRRSSRDERVRSGQGRVEAIPRIGAGPVRESTRAAAAARCSSVGTSFALALAPSCAEALHPGTGRGLKSLEYMSSAKGSGTASRKSPPS